MRVKIEYTTDVPDEYRRAINVHYGEPGLAPRWAVKEFYRSFGDSNGDMMLGDILGRMGDEDEDET